MISRISFVQEEDEISEICLFVGRLLDKSFLDALREELRENDSRVKFVIEEENFFIMVKGRRPRKINNCEIDKLEGFFKKQLCAELIDATEQYPRGGIRIFIKIAL